MHAGNRTQQPLPLFAINNGTRTPKFTIIARSNVAGLSALTGPGQPARYVCFMLSNPLTVLVMNPVQFRLLPAAFLILVLAMNPSFAQGDREGRELPFRHPPLPL